MVKYNLDMFSIFYIKFTQKDNRKYIAIVYIFDTSLNCLVFSINIFFVYKCACIF